MINPMKLFSSSVPVIRKKIGDTLTLDVTIDTMGLSIHSAGLYIIHPEIVSAPLLTSGNCDFEKNSWSNYVSGLRAGYLSAEQNSDTPLTGVLGVGSLEFVCESKGEGMFFRTENRKAFKRNGQETPTRYDCAEEIGAFAVDDDAVNPPPDVVPVFKLIIR